MMMMMISLKMDVIVQLEFELACLEAAVQHFNYDGTETPKYLYI